MIEVLALILIAFSMLLAFLSFFPQWNPKNDGWYRTIYKTLTKASVASLFFLAGMVILFLFA